MEALQKQIDRVIEMIKRKGTDNILLVLHPETKMPYYLGGLIKDLEVKRSTLVEPEELYFVEKKIANYPLNELTIEADAFLKGARERILLGSYKK